MHRPEDYDPDCGCEVCQAVEAAEVEKHAWMATAAAPALSAAEIDDVYAHRPAKAEGLKRALRLT